ncbi:DivIVA domain-containing protein [Sphaerisporangium sp. NPDC051011]|uniref:DivIVA domain-containing protein n=1 Tax=Sphaerisporangium sp. NPDC051011 TaxID=3155792 RepID=UPI003403BAA8
MNRFPRVLALRTGYDPGQVDALIRRIEATLGRGALEGPPVTADEIRMAGFGAKRGGYNEMAVDYALDAFVVAVETLPFRPAMTAGAAGTAMTTAATAGPGDGGLARLPGIPEPRRYPGGQTFHAAPVPASELAYGGTSAGLTDEPDEEEEEAPTLPGMPAVRSEGGGRRIAAAEGRPLHPQDVVAPVAGAWDPLGRNERVPWTPARAGYGPPEPEAVRSLHVGQSAEEAPSADEALAAAWLEAQAAKVERMLFRRGRFGAGYHEGQVDIFLDRVVATLRGTTDLPLTGDQVRAARFATVLFRAGYAVPQVDAFLAEVADILDRRDVLTAERAQRV